MRKLLMAATALSALALPAAAPAQAQIRADAVWTDGATVQLAQWRGHRRYHREVDRDHRRFHRRAWRDGDWDRRDRRDHRRWHREARRDHRDLHWDDRRWRDRRWGWPRSYRRYGYWGGRRTCANWWWDGWSWRCGW